MSRASPRAAGTGVVAPNGRLLHRVIDGTSVAPIAATPGNGTPASWAATASVAAPASSTAANTWRTAGSAIQIDLTAGSSVVRVPIPMPQDWTNQWLRVAAALRYRQTGAVWPAIVLRMRVFDALAYSQGDSISMAALPNPADALMPRAQETEIFTVPAPGADGAMSPWLFPHAWVRPQSAGMMVCELRLDAAGAAATHSVFLDELTVEAA